MRKSLRKFDHYFVQDDKSKKLLESIGIKNSSIGGDTRLDRVSEILKRNNQLDFMDRFKNNQLCLVGSNGASRLVYVPTTTVDAQEL